MKTWIISDELKVGSHNQCRGIAQCLGFPYEMNLVNARGIWRFLPPSLWPSPLQGLSEPLSPPWPNFIIASGRASAAPTAAIGASGKTKTVFLQNPQMSLKKFTTVIASHHDHLDGGNLIPVLGIVHSLTPEGLTQAKQRWEPVFTALPGPYTGVILGGDCKHHTFTEDDMVRLANTLNAWHKDQGGSLLITPSRRTRPDTLQKLLSHITVPYYCWDAQGDNPYVGILACADQFCVTNDSVAMMGEACYTGKPVYAFDLGLKARKFNELIEMLHAKDHIRIAEPSLKKWDVVRLDELTRIKPHLLESLSF